jgi:hypothetical protein
VKDEKHQILRKLFRLTRLACPMASASLEHLRRATQDMIVQRSAKGVAMAAYDIPKAQVTCTQQFEYQFASRREAVGSPSGSPPS